MTDHDRKATRREIADALSKAVERRHEIADATGRPVEVSAVAEGAALGAAFLARMAAGLETTIADAARWVRTERIVEPDPAWAVAVEDRYHRFLQMADRRCGAVAPPPF